MRVPSLFAALLVAIALPAAAEDCSDIVAATVAELRAGETAWDERAEAIARRAAGAACVKATSARTAVAEEPVTQSVAGETAAASTAAVAATESEGPDATAIPEEESDDGKAGWKFLGFDVNKVEGSPSQKPYERKR